MSLSTQVGALATRVGTELKSIRTNFVPNTLRGPIGGVSAATGVSGTVNLDPALSNHRRLTATGDVVVGLMSAGADGQRLLFEINASGGQRVVTFDSSYELSDAVSTRTFTIPSGVWAYIAVIYRGGTWRLISAEPQVAPDYSTPSAWVPADHGLIAWNCDPALATSSFGGAANLFVAMAVKVSASATVTSIFCGVGTAGTGLTSTRNAIGLYNAGGTLLGQTVDQTTAWASTGNKSAAMVSAVSVTPGLYFAAILANGTATPGFNACASPNPVSVGRSANSWRAGFISSGIISMPATRPTPTNIATIPWVGLG